MAATAQVFLYVLSKEHGALPPSVVLAAEALHEVCTSIRELPQDTQQ